jgi:hypothetical protein
VPETKDERINRELIELLNELRVVLPGVQVLFAFLLAVPFTQRFGQVTDLQKDAFMVTLLCTLVGTVLFTAPTAFHRIRFRDRDKEALLKWANAFTIAGLVFLAAALTAAVFVITDFLFKGPMTVIVTTFSALMFVVIWFLLPLTRELRD